MPIYEYQCKACHAHHEAIQKMSDAPLRKCPACGRQQLVRLVSAPVFRLKGGGWYETDFKSDAEGKRNLHAEEKADEAGTPDKADAAAPDAKVAEVAKADAPAGAKDPKPAGDTKAKAEPGARKPRAKAAAKPAARRRAAGTARGKGSGRR